MEYLENWKQYFAVTGNRFFDELRISHDQYLRTIIAFYSALISAIFLYLLSEDNIAFLKSKGLSGFILGIIFLSLINLVLSISSLALRYFGVEFAISDLRSYVLANDFDHMQPRIHGASGKIGLLLNYFPKFFIVLSIFSLIVQSILTFIMGLELLT